MNARPCVQVRGWPFWRLLQPAVYGCTDQEALNYNADANTDDGSCLYPCECDDVYDPVCVRLPHGETVTFNNPARQMHERLGDLGR